jgi:hypothetical protein
MRAFMGKRAVNAILVEYLGKCQYMATVSECCERIGVMLESSWGVSETKKKEIRQRSEEERVRARPGRAATGPDGGLTWAVVVAAGVSRPGDPGAAPA